MEKHRHRGCGSTDAEEKKLPRVSLIIVVRNERNWVKGAIESLVGQDYPRELLEIVLVDGMSEDGTRDELEKACAHLRKEGWAVKVLENPALILATGWNVAIRAAGGDVVCRIDAHSELYPDYVRKGVDILNLCRGENVAGVGGVLEHYGRGVLGGAIAELLASRFAVGNSPFRTDKKKRPRFRECRETDTAVYALYPKRLFNEVGYFDEELVRNQDIEFHLRVKIKGYRFLTCPQMRVKYHVRNTLGALVRKAFLDGYWTAISGNAFLRHRMPAIFVSYVVLYVCMLSVRLLEVKNWWLWMALSMPLLFYLVLDVICSIKDASGLNKVVLLWLFPIFHVSYGIGSLKGQFSRMGRLFLEANGA
ncbi:glycosyltransferase family 2 protein [Deferrisoma palaeochoriense]